MIGDRKKLEAQLGYTFRDPDSLTQALTHRSAGKSHNERLEFLGDAILDMVIAELLFDRYPEATEGMLSRMRANLVNRDVLADVAASLELGNSLNLGTGERKSGGKRRASILADAVEALLAAIYLESDLGTVREVVEKLFDTHLDSRDTARPRKDSKTRLQELMQSRGMPLPDYSVKQVSGEAHDQTFTVECAVVALAAPLTGTGKSKRMAEQSAARRVLAVLESQS